MKRLKLSAGFITGLFLVTIGVSFYASPALIIGVGPFLVTALILGTLVLATSSDSNLQGKMHEGLSQVGARLMFENAKNFLATFTDTDGTRYQVADAKATMGYIRGEVPLVAGTPTYNIPLLESQKTGTTRVNNKLVFMQDVFVTNQIGIFIGIGAATESAAKLYTYGNQIAFSTANAAASLISIYNGNMQLLNNNVQVLTNWDLLRHYKVPSIQAITDLYYDGTAVQQDALDLSCDGFYPVEPGLVINGAGKMQMQIIANGGPTAIQADSFICVIQRGILFQNVTTVK